MTHRLLVSGLVAAVATFSALPALAGPLSLHATVNVSDATSTTVFTPSPVGGDANGLYSTVTYWLNDKTKRSANAGLFVLNYRAVDSTGDWTQFLSFCLEPDVDLLSFSNPYTVRALGSGDYSAPSKLISELWTRYRGEVKDDVTAAAFQVALWELAYGTTDRNLGTGVFRLESAREGVSSTAQYWLTNLKGDGSVSANLRVLVDNSGDKYDRQDLIVEVPEPATLGLFGLALAGLAVRRRSRSR